MLEDAYAALDRLVRVHAAGACERLGLMDQAEILRSLSTIMDSATAQQASWPVITARRRCYASVWSHDDDRDVAYDAGNADKLIPMAPPRVVEDFRASQSFRDALSVRCGALSIVTGAEYDLGQRELALLRREADDNARAKQAIGIGD